MLSSRNVGGKWRPGWLDLAGPDQTIVIIFEFTRGHSGSQQKFSRQLESDQTDITASKITSFFSLGGRRGNHFLCFSSSEHLLLPHGCFYFHRGEAR